MKKFIAWVVAMFVTFNTTLNILMKKSYQDEVEENAIKYQDDIEKYDEYIKEYAKYINSLELNDLEIIMKVMKDSWDNVKGYASVDDLPLGYYRLTLFKDGIGVCTSFADDFTAKLNAINPIYDAKNIIVYVNDIEDKDKMHVVENIDVKIVETVKSDEDVEKKQKKYGNHMVSIIKIPNKDLHLMVDPTNLLIGIVKDGKIDVLNYDAEQELMEYMFKSNLYFLDESYIGTYKYYYDVIKDDVNISDIELDKMYGIEAQEKAIEKVDDIETPKQLKKIYE